MILVFDSFSQKAYEYKENINDTVKGAINTKGGVIIENKYRYFRRQSDYIVAHNFIGSSDLYNNEGKLLMKNIKNFEFKHGSSYIMYCKDFNGQMKWALYSLEGKQVTDYIYSRRDIWVYSTFYLKNYYDVKKDVEYQLIDSTGTPVISSKNEEEYRKKQKKFISEYQKNKKENYDIMDCEEDIDEDYKVTKLINKETGKYGLKINNVKVLPSVYESINQKCCDCFVIELNKKYGVFHASGKMVLEPIYDKIENIAYNTTIIASYNGKYAVYSIDTGEKVFDKEYGFIDFL